MSPPPAPGLAADVHGGGPPPAVSKRGLARPRREGAAISRCKASCCRGAAESPQRTAGCAPVHAHVGEGGPGGKGVHGGGVCHVGVLPGAHVRGVTQ